MRFVAQGDFYHLLGRSHFKVHGQADALHDGRQILIANVSPVFTQVNRNSVTARRLDDFNCAHRIRMHAAARVADRRDVIDIHSKA